MLVNYWNYLFFYINNLSISFLNFLYLVSIFLLIWLTFWFIYIFLYNLILKRIIIYLYSNNYITEVFYNLRLKRQFIGFFYGFLIFIFKFILYIFNINLFLFEFIDNYFILIYIYIFFYISFFIIVYFFYIFFYKIFSNLVIYLLKFNCLIYYLKILNNFYFFSNLSFRRYLVIFLLSFEFFLNLLGNYNFYRIVFLLILFVIFINFFFFNFFFKHINLFESIGYNMKVLKLFNNSKNLKFSFKIIYLNILNFSFEKLLDLDKNSILIILNSIFKIRFNYNYKFDFNFFFIVFLYFFYYYLVIFFIIYL